MVQVLIDRKNYVRKGDWQTLENINSFNIMKVTVRTNKQEFVSEYRYLGEQHLITEEIYKQNIYTQQKLFVSLPYYKQSKIVSKHFIKVRMVYRKLGPCMKFYLSVRLYA